jgi:hypothetical protein
MSSHIATMLYTPNIHDLHDLQQPTPPSIKLSYHTVCTSPLFFTFNMSDCPPMVFDQPYPIRFDLDGHTDTGTLTTSPFCALSHMCNPNGTLMRLKSPSPIRVDMDSPISITIRSIPCQSFSALFILIFRAGRDYPLALPSRLSPYQWLLATIYQPSTAMDGWHC